MKPFTMADPDLELREGPRLFAFHGGFSSFGNFFFVFTQNKVDGPPSSRSVMLVTDRVLVNCYRAYLSNRPQVSMVYRLINQAGCS